MNPTANLKPAAVWHYFSELMNIPRPSKHEELVSAFLQKFGRSHGYETLADEVGNVLIRKPAFRGYEKAPGVCLQAHMDMVCEKNSDTRFDFMKDPIQAEIEDGWLIARNTTLGADDGIGVAAALAILDDKTIPHGPLECLFTVDEETGLTGAANLHTDWLKSDILLNFDDEDEGEFCIGCAGGIDTVAELTYKPVATKGGQAFRITVSGLQGGHSGDDIHRGRGCAVKILNRILWQATRNLGARLAHIDGGNLRNAIAREAMAVVTIPAKQAKALNALVARYDHDIRFEFRSTEADLHIGIVPEEMPKQLIDKATQDRLLASLYACAHGVLSMSREIPNFVETSTNLASVKMTNGNVIRICTSQRSSVESAKHAAAEKIEATFRLAGARIEHSDGYPGWTPNPDSRVLKTGVETYRRMFGHEPIVRAIHAGLECGLIGEKYPKMDMISYGPTLRGVHAPGEKIEIKTVQMFWDLTLEILKSLKD